jgi:hypothetical protein
MEKALRRSQARSREGERVFCFVHRYARGRMTYSFSACTEVPERHAPRQPALHATACLHRRRCSRIEQCLARASPCSSQKVARTGTPSSRAPRIALLPTAAAFAQLWAAAREKICTQHIRHSKHLPGTEANPGSTPDHHPDGRSMTPPNGLVAASHRCWVRDGAGAAGSVLPDTPGSGPPSGAPLSGAVGRSPRATVLSCPICRRASLSRKSDAAWRSHGPNCRLVLLD